MDADQLGHRSRDTGSWPARQPRGDDDSYQDAFARVRELLVPAEGWSTDVRDMWCVVSPPGTGLRVQGWKIHLSATPRSAVRVLTAAAHELLRTRVAFKFARSPGVLGNLLAIRMDRGSGGKFLTVYPDDDTQFVRLLDALHEATTGLDGPAILSDRRYRPGSLVHYRYGGFGGLPARLEDDGSYVPVLVGPDGGWTPDRRNAWFSPPPWAALPPLPAAAASAPRSGGSPGGRTPSTVLLGGRFLVREAIRHSNRGGVYRAVDRHDGDRAVVVKEARPHIDAKPDGTDARDYLRNEHRILTMLEPLGIAARPVDLFEYQGHVFVAAREVPGATLYAWARARLQREPRRSLTSAQVLPTARRLVDLVAAVHDKGLVLRDLTPSNVVVTPEETLQLIDTEFVAAANEPVSPVGTPGFVAPEVRAGANRVGAATTIADLYGLGATLFHLCVGSVPIIPTDRPGAGGGSPRPHDERVRRLVAAAAVDSPALAALAPIVTGLMRERPECRPTLAEVREVLDVPAAAPVAAAPVALAPADADRLLTDGWDELLAALNPRADHAPWPAPAIGGVRFDPFAVQAGAGGILEVLRRGALTGYGGQRLFRGLHAALTWLDERADREPRQLPGLYFGRAGTYWAMYEAAGTVGAEEIQQRSLRRARQLPVVWPAADITHGLAGNGLAQLHLWRRTGQREFRDRAQRCATALLDARTSQGRRWLEPAELRTTDNASDLGFAHGIAGMATFLMNAGQHLGRAQFFDAAVRSGELLLSLAREDGDGITWSPADPRGDGDERGRIACWWCNGAPGIGTFLIRLSRATGDDRFREAAHRAAVSARRQRWMLSFTHCHGLAGNGEFLLDMAAITGESRYRDWAAEHVTALQRFSALRENRLVVTDSDTDLHYSYNLGMAGPIGFLHRFHHGGERWWMTDDFTLAAPGRGRAVRTTQDPTTER